MHPALKYLLVGVVGLVALLGLLVLLAALTEHRPDPVEPVAVSCEGATTPLKVGEPIKILSWNVQYGASRKHQFFYDGGQAVHVPIEDVKETTAAIASALSAYGADVLLLQEIDSDSARTHRINQGPIYKKGAGAVCEAVTTYHRSPFVPSPTTNPLGRVDMGLQLLTRSAPLAKAERIQLALLDEPRIVQMFNLKRALLTAEVPIEGWPQPLALAVTHLSAFSKGDGTLAKQVAQLRAWMDARPKDQPWILAGDFNLLPPGDDPGRLAAEGDAYRDPVNPMEALLKDYRDIFGDAQLDPMNRTYLPFGFPEPDRKIDYVLVGGPIEVIEAKVLREHAAISDHLPLVATLRIGPAPAPPEPPAEGVPPGSP
jgi:endonuclease/exonuclease/phosphatase family metal-dependent hydrolase